MNSIVLGIFASADVEGVIDNLTEADFDEKDMSLIMKDEKEARAILDDGGPLLGISLEKLSDSLKKLGVTNEQQYVNEVSSGNALLVLKSPGNAVDIAKEMFTDGHAQLLSVL